MAVAISPFVILLGYIIFNSPLAAPLYRSLAERHFKKKKYLPAAKLYQKLHHFQEHLEGLVYAKKAALAYEMAGSIQEALESYRRAQDWPKVGQLLVELGKIEQARELYREQGLHQRLALLYEQENQYLEAGQIYLFELKSLHKANSCLRRACDSSDPERRLQAHLHLSQVHLGLKRLSEARAEFELADREINSSPQFQEFPDLLQLRAQVQLQVERQLSQANQDVDAT